MPHVHPAKRALLASPIATMILVPDLTAAVTMAMREGHQHWTDGEADVCGTVPRFWAEDLLQRSLSEQEFLVEGWQGERIDIVAERVVGLTFTGDGNWVEPNLWCRACRLSHGSQLPQHVNHLPLQPGARTPHAPPTPVVVET